MRNVWCIAALGLLSGCMNYAKPVTIKDAITNVERDLIGARVVSISATTLSNPTESALFDDDVLIAQCSQSMADPDIPLMQQGATLRLSGAFNANAQLSVTGFAGPPIGTIDGSVDDNKTQEADIPIDFTVLSEVPDKVAAERLKIAAPDRVNEITLARDQLQARVNTLIAGFTPAACSKAQINGTAPPLLGYRRGGEQ